MIRLRRTGETARAAPARNLQGRYTPRYGRTAAEIAESCATSDDPSDNQILVEHDGGVVGYATIRWWQERDGRWP